MPQDSIDVLQKTVETTSIFGYRIFDVIFSVLVAGGGAAMWLRKKLSKDNLDIKKDDAEAGLIEHLENTRDNLQKEKDSILNRLLEVDKERQQAVEQVGRLSTEVEHLSRQVVKLEELVRVMTDKLDTASTQLHEFAIENAKLSEKMSNIKELFELKYNPKRIN